jgi:hypothetical protein
MTNKAMEAMSWALAGSHLRVYPVVQKNTYNANKSVTGGKPRSVQVNYVKLCIEIGNAKHIGKEIYKQDESMTNKIMEIYCHYYDQRSDK